MKPLSSQMIRRYQKCGLSRMLHHDIHWLDVTERIQFRVAATVYQCLHGMGPAYLTCVSKSSWRSSVRHKQQFGRTTLQTVNLWHPCVQCRWSSLLECLTGLLKVVRSFVRLKHFYFVDTDTSTTVAH